MRTHYLIVLIIVLACVGCNRKSEPSREFSHYTIETTVFPTSQLIKSKGHLAYLISSEQTNIFGFYLHKNLIISSLKINNKKIKHFKTSPSNIRWMPDAQFIECDLSKWHQKGEVLHIDFEYQGVINEWPGWSANVITGDWIEIGGYFPWYPKIEERFTYQLGVTMDAKYHFFSSGTRSFDNHQIWFDQQNPSSSIILCASKDLKLNTINTADLQLNIANTILADSIVSLLKDDVQFLYNYYSGLFENPTTNSLDIVISKRKKGGGYAREASIYLGGLSNEKYFNNRINYQRYLAHEIAHLWWHNANTTTDDWLNESFAEFSALLTIKELHGPEAYNNRILKKIEESKDCPPIWNLDREHPKAYAVLYSKGVVALDLLSNTIGSDEMHILMKQILLNKTENTFQLLDLVEELYGHKIRSDFENHLRNL